jgi:uncharacterized OsmC-like protein
LSREIGRSDKSHYWVDDSAVMGFVSAGFTDAIVALAERVKDQQVLSTVTAEVRLTGAQSSEAKVKDFTVISDEPKSVGGTDSAPTPTGHFAASIGFCVNVVLARHAALHAIDFDSLETRVTGHWDIKGLFAIEGRDAAFQDFIIETYITTDAPHEKVVEAFRLAHRGCPITATLNKAAKVTTKLFLNGNEIPI